MIIKIFGEKWELIVENKDRGKFTLIVINPTPTSQITKGFLSIWYPMGNLFRTIHRPADCRKKPKAEIFQSECFHLVLSVLSYPLRSISNIGDLDPTLCQTASYSKYRTSK